MEYIYAAMLLHKAGKKVEEAHLKKVLEAAGITVNEAKVKALVSALNGVDIDKAISEASLPTAVSAQSAVASTAKPTEKKEEKKEEKKSEEEAAAGLGALFG